MSLQPPVLDTRSFQKIVDQAKGMITQYCPEWTDHNVSDPGVALIELFAWMTDALLHRVNRVPDEMYEQFLQLIGMRLAPPQPAHAPITFYLAATATTDVPIKAGTEVATVRTENKDPIIFTTTADFVIHPPVVVGERVYIEDASQPQQPWLESSVKRHNQIFPYNPNTSLRPAPGDAFYIPLEQNHSHHVLALVLTCQEAAGQGVKPANPPLIWEVSQGRSNRWKACDVEYDTTGGFSYRQGEVLLRLPAMAQERHAGVEAYWLRCRLTDFREETGRYNKSPIIESMRVEARGGTVRALHMSVIENEVLGRSDGTAGQTFWLRHTPILERDPAEEYLIVKLPDGTQEDWREMPDFSTSTAEDRHFTLDSVSGKLALGPSLLQPDGTFYRFGQVPPKGAQLCFRRYRHGRRIEKVSAGDISILKTSDPRITRITNWQAAEGGKDAQTIEDAKLRSVPKYLRTRTTAVTARDYEFLACEVPGVERALCLAPGEQLGTPTDRKPGEVVVVRLQ